MLSLFTKPIVSIYLWWNIFDWPISHWFSVELRMRNWIESNEKLEINHLPMEFIRIWFFFWRLTQLQFQENRSKNAKSRAMFNFCHFSRCISFGLSTKQRIKFVRFTWHIILRMLCKKKMRKQCDIWLKMQWASKIEYNNTIAGTFSTLDLPICPINCFIFVFMLLNSYTRSYIWKYSKPKARREKITNRWCERFLSPNLLPRYGRIPLTLCYAMSIDCHKQYITTLKFSLCSLCVAHRCVDAVYCGCASVRMLVAKHINVLDV